MKILFSLLAFCLFASCVHSQEAVDTVSVRVQYRVKYNERNINNVKDHPEFAGNPNNIEFVKRPEHLDAHGGNFRNETHGELLNRNPNKD